MRQLPHLKPERRRDPRHPKAFAFWVRTRPAERRVGAWMLDLSAGGAAFLTESADAPAVGQRIELVEMQSRDRIVREDAGPLPMFARVLRHDDASGVTCRVAVRFEADAAVPLRPRVHQVDTMACPSAPGCPPVPPPALSDPAGRVSIPAPAIAV